MFVRIKGEPLHPECFKCVKCAKSLKNQGSYAADSVVAFSCIFISVLARSHMRIYRVGQKVAPKVFFAVFSATVWNFSLTFYRII